jgi:hypothetical protein
MNAFTVIRNTLFDENCLTGLTVVQGRSWLMLSDNAFVGNGEHQIAIFRDIRSEDDEQNGTLESVYGHSNVIDIDSPTPEAMEATLIRNPSVWHRRLSRDSLLDLMRDKPVDGAECIDDSCLYTTV